MILLDTGSSHNFLDFVLIKTLQLAIDTTRILEVRVANGDLIRNKGECKNLLIKMQGKDFLVDLQVISWDFKKLEMEFMYQGMMVWLQGIRSTGSVIQDGDQFLKQSTQKGLFLQIVS